MTSISIHKSLEKSFVTEDFILKSDVARRLYFEYAKDMPIIDYHCHLSPEQIATDHKFENLTDIWLKGDHYKWRAMRALGIDESFITGTRPDREKFLKWAEAVPYTMRNPLYHWTHMELKNPFEVDYLLNPKSAEFIYDFVGEKINDWSTNTILNHFKVEVVGTTDDPCDSLHFHHKIKTAQNRITVVPTFRPDQLLNIDQLSLFSTYIQRLAAVSKVSISTFDDLLSAIKERHDYFHGLGCRASDHGQIYLFAEDYTIAEVKSIFNKALQGLALSPIESAKYKSAIQYELAVLDWSRGWVQQFHLGAIRNNNSRLLNTLGKDIGVDSIGDYLQIEAMSKFFDRLDQENKLTKTIIYNVNPVFNAAFATMAGNFQDGTIRGKMQFGSGWWFLDQKDGMTDQINILSNMGVLSCFVGMITDSRSFLSFPRHEYFRRILCNLFGNDILQGELPNDIDWIGKLIQDICYTNAKNYFNF